MPEASSLRLLTWWAGTVRCAAPTDRIREVLPCPAITPIPCGEPAVRGVANIRGIMVTVVDGRRLIGQPDTEPGAELVLLDLNGQLVGLTIDRVEDLFTVRDLAPGRADSGEGWTVKVGPGDPARLLDPDLLLAPLFER